MNYTLALSHGHLWHTFRNADGSWQEAFNEVELESDSDPGLFSAVSCAGTGDQLQVIGNVDGHLWHTFRDADGSWQEAFNEVELESDSDPGLFSAVSCAGTGDQLQVIGIVDGHLWHTFRDADGSWQEAFNEVELESDSDPGLFSAVSCAGTGDQLQVIGVS